MHNKFKQIVAALLIATQVFYSTQAAAVDMGSVLDIASQVLNGLAGAQQNQQSGTISQLPQNPIIVAQSGPGSTDAMGAIAHGQQAVFDPTNTQAAQKLMDNLVAAKRAIYNKSTLTPRDVYTYSTAMRPFMLYLENYSRIKNGGDIVVMPGQTVSADINSYCIDPNASIPGYGEKMQLLPAGKVVNPRLQPLYDGVMQYANTHDDQRTTIQGILHHLRSASEGNGVYLNDWEKPVLNAAVPDGVRKLDDFQKYVAAEKKKKRWQAPVDNKAQALNRWKDIAEIAPNVTAKTTINSNGPEAAKVTFSNTSNKPFIFNPSQYVALSENQHIQRTGISGIKNIYGSNGQPIFTEEGRRAAEDIVGDAKDTFAGKSMLGGIKDAVGVATDNPVVQDLIKSTPMVGTGIAMWELANNKDFFTGQKLTPANKILAWASLVPGEGSLARILGTSSRRVIQAAAETKEIGGALESNTAQAVAGQIDDKVFSGEDAARSVYKALDDFAGEATTPADVARSIKDAISIKPGSASGPTTGKNFTAKGRLKIIA